MIDLVTKKLTFETTGKPSPKGGIMFTATLSTIIPRSKRGRELDEERKLLVIEDRDKAKK